jgi:hypothetical protein
VKLVNVHYLMQTTQNRKMWSTEIFHTSTVLVCDNLRISCHSVFQYFLAIQLIQKFPV